ncbi:polyphosphate polymerase domain-containing protein [Natronosporangium hydrolyticum]|uniref:Polyphosphate polymerase domain-containing protein n=1 Tax=Natronosporangium hydrolyticum TaxID=2811111 RepID=A0A895YKL3_9ACTN|nr:polyphosphate polymerase domain-containing protein [Natronosporangium hydrolyticum]QSB16525.1 polyphosphate polymerase domain-containing protein [Natronosporangium hydrolyticum]
MSVLTVDSPLHTLAPIGLTELLAQAELQTRTDRKYVLPIAELPDFLTAIGSRARVLEIDGTRSFGYESVYFDTPELTSYLLAAHRRRRRFKVRTRTYLDSHQCWLEVKTRGRRGSTVKHRHPYDPAHRAMLAPGRAFVDGVLAGERLTDYHRLRFAPSLTTRYQRSTLFLPDSASRVTIDTELTCHDQAGELAVPHLAIVETKTSSAASDIDRLLRDHRHRPVRISKYGTGMAALHPDLPATPWRRTLRRHFAATPAAHPHPRWLPAS